MKMRRSARPLYLMASLFLLVPCPHPATAQLLGPEFQVNSYTTSAQSSPAVAADGSGNFVVVWESLGQDGSGYSAPYGVFGQRFNSAGSRVGSEFRVNSYTTNSQRDPAVTVDGSGNFVVAWDSLGQDGSAYGVFGQRYNSAGSPVGSEFRVNSYTTNSQRQPTVAADGSGNFVVVWHSGGQDGSSYGVFGQRLDSVGSPVGSEFRVNTYTTGGQFFPAVAANDSGSFVVVWHSDGQDGSSFGVFGQRFSSAGIPQGSEFQVNTYTTSYQSNPAVAADGSGNFVVAWESSGQDGSSFGVFGRRYNSAGSPVGSEFRVNTYTPNIQRVPAVAADGSGSFVVVWHSDGQDGSSYGVFGQRFNSAGSPVGSEFQVNTYTTSYQLGPAVATDSSGKFVVAWQSFGQDGSGSGLFGKRMTIAIFSDGFESGDFSLWSSVAP